MAHEQAAAEVSRQEFDMMAQQLAEMQGQLAASREQNAALEQAMSSLVEGLQAEKDNASRDDFYSEFEYEFGGRRDYADRAWRMYEDSGKSADRREFVSRLVSQMDNEMRDYLAAKGMEVAIKSGESGSPEVRAEEAPQEMEIRPAEEAAGEPGDPRPQPEGEPAVRDLPKKGLSDREKINRLLTQDEQQKRRNSGFKQSAAGGKFSLA